MPRNISGVYTLPAGNPVAPNTVIESVWANTTLSDLAQAMTDSLDRFGRGVMLAPLKISDGSQAAPGLSFASEAGTGIFKNGAGALGLSALGTLAISTSDTMTQLKLPTTVMGDLPDTARFAVGTNAFTLTSPGRGIVEVNGSAESIIGLSIGGAHRAAIWTRATDTLMWTTDSAPLMFGTNGAARLRIADGGITFLVAPDWAGPPTVANHLANKAYVDSAISGSGAFLPITGGVLLAPGHLTVPGSLAVTGGSAFADNLRVGGGTQYGRLSVSSPFGVVLTLDSTAANGGYAQFMQAGAAYGYVGSANVLVGGAAVDALAVRSEKDLLLGAGGGFARMNLRSNGDVDIGMSAQGATRYFMIGAASQAIQQFYVGGALEYSIAIGNAFSVLDSPTNTFVFGAGGAERMRLDAATGHVGMGNGTIGPSSQLTIYGNGSESASPLDSDPRGGTIQVMGMLDGPGSGGAIFFGTNNPNPFAYIKAYIHDASSNTLGDLIFGVRRNVTDTFMTESMRITAAGAVTVPGSFTANNHFVGATTGSGGVFGNAIPANGPQMISWGNATVGAGNMRFYGASVLQLEIAPVPSAVNYWRFEGGTAGQRVNALAQGEANVGINLVAKGAGDILLSSNGGIGVQVTNSGPATRWLQVSGSNTDPMLNTVAGRLNIAAPAMFSSATPPPGGGVGSTYTYANASSLGFVVATKTPNNRVHEFVASDTAFGARFLNDGYSAATDWLQVIGGQGTGVQSINLLSASGTKIFANNSSEGLALTDTGPAGANLMFVGNGAVSPRKYIRVTDGIFQILNSAYSASLLGIYDNGLMIDSAQRELAIKVWPLSAAASIGGTPAAGTPSDYQNKVFNMAGNLVVNQGVVGSRTMVANVSGTAFTLTPGAGVTLRLAGNAGGALGSITVPATSGQAMLYWANTALVLVSGVGLT